MKKIEFYLNIFHFCFYKFYYEVYLISLKINPFKFLHNLPFQKKRYEKLGIDIRKEINRAYSDKNFGICLMNAGGTILLLIFLLIFGLVGTTRKNFTNEILVPIHFVIFALLSIIICTFFVFRQDKYIRYFEKFEKWTRVEKIKYSWLTFAFTIVVFYLWLLSF